MEQATREMAFKEPDVGLGVLAHTYRCSETGRQIAMNPSPGPQAEFRAAQSGPVCYGVERAQ